MAPTLIRLDPDAWDSIIISNQSGPFLDVGFILLAQQGGNSCGRSATGEKGCQ